MTTPLGDEVARTPEEVQRGADTVPTVEEEPLMAEVAMEFAPLAGEGDEVLGQSALAAERIVLPHNPELDAALSGAVHQSRDEAEESAELDELVLAELDAEFASASQEVTRLEAELHARTVDAQRVAAEYANYRKRVARDEGQAQAETLKAVFGAMLTLLDDVARAESHDALTGTLKAVSDSLHSVCQRFGVERFGEAGEAFDPRLHEALTMDEPDPHSSVAVCTKVLMPGWRLGESILRPARVSVSEGTYAEPAFEWTIDDEGSEDPSTSNEDPSKEA